MGVPYGAVVRACRDPDDGAPSGNAARLQDAIACLLAMSFDLGSFGLGARARVEELMRRVSALQRPLGQRR
jgi:hypothetical protein